MPTLRTLALVLPALPVAAPAMAQFGIKKKIRAAATGEKDQPAAADTGGETGGTLVLDDDVIERMIKGLRAAKARREAAMKEDTPYARYLNGKAAHAEARRSARPASRRSSPGWWRIRSFRRRTAATWS